MANNAKFKRMMQTVNSK